MKKVFLLLAIMLVTGYAKAQDDLLGELQKDDSAQVKQNITIATFKSTRVINMHSVEMTGTGNLQFMIIHHFGEIWDKSEGGSNIGRLFGLNGNFASTYMSFDYTPVRWLNIGAAFAGQSTIEGTAKFKLLRQQTGQHKYPVSVAYLSTARVNTSKKDPSPNGFVWNKFTYMHQFLIARKFSEKLSLQLIPSVIHNNITTYGYDNAHNVYSVGLGGRFKLTDKTAITFEYARQLNNYKNVVDKSGEIISYSPDLISIGYDWDTGGHIFQFFVSNSSNASNIVQLATNPKRDNIGQFSLGFNLNRSYSIKKRVKL
jgi:Membrane bound beta barrel domain (DUF5777)